VSEFLLFAVKLCRVFDTYTGNI